MRSNSDLSPLKPGHSYNRMFMVQWPRVEAEGSSFRHHIGVWGEVAERHTGAGELHVAHSPELTLS